MRAKSPKPERAAEIELRPDGWDRFERAVDAAVKTPARPGVRKPKDRSAPKRPIRRRDVAASLSADEEGQSGRQLSEDVELIAVLPFEAPVFLEPSPRNERSALPLMVRFDRGRCSTLNKQQP